MKKEKGIKCCRISEVGALQSFRFAFKQIIPLLFSYLFVGIASGILLNEAGYAPIWAFFSALLIYAGSMQIVLVSLLTSGVSLVMAALMTLFINARHVFYGIGFIERFRRVGGWKYPYMALTLTDETYSVLCTLQYPETVEPDKVNFDILALCHALWVASCTLGALVGQLLPFDMTGIDFSATALFTVVVVNQWRQFDSHIPAVAGFFSALVFYFVLGPDRFILPALSVSMVVLLLLRGRILRTAEVTEHD